MYNRHPALGKCHNKESGQEPQNARYLGLWPRWGALQVRWEGHCASYWHCLVLIQYISSYLLTCIRNKQQIFMLAWYYTVENLDRPSKLAISTYLKPTSPRTHSIIPGHYPVLSVSFAAAAAGCVEGFVCVSKIFYSGHPYSWLLLLSFTCRCQLRTMYVTVANEVSIQIVTQSEALSFHGLHGLVVQFSPLWVC